MKVVEHVKVDGCEDVTVVYEPRDHYVDFHAAVIFSTDASSDGVHLGIVYERKGGSTNLDWVTDPMEAEPLVSGAVKWDGCVNFQCGDQNHVMMHACHRAHLERISRVLCAVYERAAELLGDNCDFDPKWIDRRAVAEEATTEQSGRDRRERER